MQPVLSLLPAAAVKAAAILASAGLVTTLWRSASASAKHLVWTVAMVAAVVLPLAGVMIAKAGTPKISIPVWTPTVTIAAEIAPAENHLSPLEPMTAGLERLPESSAGNAIADETSASAADFENTPADDAVVSTISETQAPVVRENAEIALPALGAMVASSVGGGIFSRWRASLAIVWAAGALLALLPILVAIAKVRLLARSASPITNGRWTRIIRETPSIRHLESRVRILESDETSMPMTWGIVHPTLLVPAKADEWSDWKCRNILLHELAHVERRDCLTQLIAQIACSIYWFNPLAWVGAHKMRVERELACDDRVLTAGSIASDYAQNLLDVARSLRAPSFTSQTAIAMARPSQLSGRLLAVLDSRRNRRAVSRSVFAGAAFSALASVVVLASITTRATVATAAEAPAPAAPSIVSDGISGFPAATGTAGYLPVALPIVKATQIPALGIVASFPSNADHAIPSVFSAPPALSVAAAGALAFNPQGAESCWTETTDGKSSTSISDNSNDSRRSWNIRYSRDNCTLEVRAEGKFTVRPDLSDLESIDNDGWFRIEETEGRESRRVEIRRAAGGGLEHKYYVNGDRAEYNESARAWLAQTLLGLERRTAFSAESRVPQLYRSGGLKGVLSEIAQMPSAYAKSKYYSTFISMDVRLDSNTLNDVVRSASRDLSSSDYYMTEVLSKLASQPSVNEATWRTFAEAAGRMKSDYYKSTLLKKVLNSGKLAPETVRIMLTSAAGLESDYYLSDLLKSVASKYALNNETRAVYAQALGRIKSDYYQMELLRAMNTADAWEPATTAFVLASVGKMQSDYYKSESLISLVKEKHVNDWRTYFNAVGSIQSDHYKRESLNAALRQTPLTREIVEGVLATAAKIKSDYEVAEVLSTVARNYKIDDQLRPSYEKAVDAIESDYYRGSALSALRRSTSR